VYEIPKGVAPTNPTSLTIFETPKTGRHTATSVRIRIFATEEGEERISPQGNLQKENHTESFNRKGEIEAIWLREAKWSHLTKLAYRAPPTGKVVGISEPTPNPQRTL